MSGRYILNKDEFEARALIARMLSRLGVCFHERWLLDGKAVYITDHGKVIGIFREDA